MQAGTLIQSTARKVDTGFSRTTMLYFFGADQRAFK